MKKETFKIGLHKSEITYIQVDGITHHKCKEMKKMKTMAHEDFM